MPGVAFGSSAARNTLTNCSAMFRKIWIFILASALVTFAAVSGVLVYSWVEHQHIPGLGWLLLVSDALVFVTGVGYLRFRMREAQAEVRQRVAALSAAEGLGHLANVSGPGAAAAANDLGAGAAPFGR